MYIYIYTCSLFLIMSSGYTMIFAAVPEMEPHNKLTTLSVLVAEECVNIAEECVNVAERCVNVAD